MALPTKAQILTGEYSADGSPYMQTVSKSTINPSQLEYSANGTPWWGVPDNSLISRVATVTLSSIQKLSSIAYASISKIAGITK